MKVGKIETHKRYDSTKFGSYGIKTFGEHNDYPNRIKELLNNSVTGSACDKIYKSFIQGEGFINQEKVNEQDLNQLLPLIADDLATFGGFALVVNYNLNYEVCSLYHIPFENVRLAYNEKGVKIHPDWGRRNVAIKQFDAKDIVNLPFYNPALVEEQVLEAGGLENYKGQCYYYSNKGGKCYPLPIFDAALSDMSTEEAISDITHRNAKNGFYPAGVFVNVSNDSDIEDTAVEQYLQYMQGSVNASKIGYLSVKAKEEIPEFLPFTANNYDKDFTVSREAVKDSIGRAFNQPAILRNENVSTGFSADNMKNAYQVYNAITKGERIVITKAFEEFYPDYNWDIIALKYGDDIEDKDKIVEILTNPNINDEVKKRILITLYKVPEDDVNSLLGKEIEL